MDVNQVFAIVRRIAEAITDGRLEAKKVAAMSDFEIAAYDGNLFAALTSAQAASEMLGHEGEGNEQE